MRARILYHDHCFDGAASAAFFTRFLEDRFYPGCELAFTGMAHKAAQLFEDSLFDGDVNAIVDFKYSTNPRLTWWFDHHQSAFLTPEDAEHWKREANPQKLYDPSYRSCTNFIRTMTAERWDYHPTDLDELVKWADIIDGALHPTPKDAVELPASAQKLTLVIEGSKGSGLVQQIIRWMRHKRLDEIIAEPAVQEVWKPLYERHLKSIDIIREKAEYKGGVVFFDLIDYDLEGYNKFIPYYLYPDSTYTVSVSTSTFRTKVSVGSNPWVREPLKHNLASICERYGGGGHAKVGAISFGVGEIEPARRAAAEIREELQA
jgi:hypothetical protein